MRRSNVLAALVVLCLGVSRVGATPAFVQGAQSATGFGVTSNGATSGTASAGNLLALYVGCSQGAPPTLNSVTGNSNTYVIAAGPTTQGSAGTATTGWLVYAKNINSGSTTSTANYSASCAVANLSVHEVSGLDTAAPLDQALLNPQATANGTNGATSTSVTTGADGEYIFGGTYNDNSEAATAGTTVAFTLRSGTNVPSTEDFVQTTAGAIAATFNYASGFGTTVTGILTFKAAGGATCTPTLMLLGVGRCG